MSANNHKHIIGVWHDYDNTTLITYDELCAKVYENEHIKDKFIYLAQKPYSLDDYLDKRVSTNLDRFDYCPFCGAKIDYKSLRERCSMTEKQIVNSLSVCADMCDVNKNSVVAALELIKSQSATIEKQRKLIDEYQNNCVQSITDSANISYEAVTKFISHLINEIPEVEPDAFECCSTCKMMDKQDVEAIIEDLCLKYCHGESSDE